MLTGAADDFKLMWLRLGYIEMLLFELAQVAVVGCGSNAFHETDSAALEEASGLPTPSGCALSEESAFAGRLGADRVVSIVIAGCPVGDVPVILSSEFDALFASDGAGSAIASVVEALLARCSGLGCLESMP